jgi:hypothetical protein
MNDPKITKYLVIVACLLRISLLAWLKKGSIPKVYAVLTNHKHQFYNMPHKHQYLPETSSHSNKILSKCSLIARQFQQE